MKLDVNEPGSGWHKSMDIKTQGYEGSMHWKKVEGLNVNLVRVDILFKGIKMQSHIDVIKNGPPSENFKEKRLIRAKSEDDRIIYIRVQPPLISERENLVRYTKKNLDNGKTLIYLRSVLDDEIPLKPNVVRMEMMKL